MFIAICIHQCVTFLVPFNSFELNRYYKWSNYCKGVWGVTNEFNPHHLLILLKHHYKKYNIAFSHVSLEIRCFYCGRKYKWWIRARGVEKISNFWQTYPNATFSNYSTMLEISSVFFNEWLLTFVNSWHVQKCDHCTLTNASCLRVIV